MTPETNPSERPFSQEDILTTCSVINADLKTYRRAFTVGVGLSVLLTTEPFIDAAIHHDIPSPLSLAEGSLGVAIFSTTLKFIVPEMKRLTMLRRVLQYPPPLAAMEDTISGISPFAEPEKRELSARTRILQSQYATLGQTAFFVSTQRDHVWMWDRVDTMLTPVTNNPNKLLYDVQDAAQEFCTVLSFSDRIDRLQSIAASAKQHIPMEALMIPERLHDEHTLLLAAAAGRANFNTLTLFKLRDIILHLKKSASIMGWE